MAEGASLPLTFLAVAAADTPLLVLLPGAPGPAARDCAPPPAEERWGEWVSGEGAACARPEAAAAEGEVLSTFVEATKPAGSNPAIDPARGRRGGALPSPLPGVLTPPWLLVGGVDLALFVPVESGGSGVVDIGAALLAVARVAGGGRTARAAGA